jgi:hypothetical protein
LSRKNSLDGRRSIQGPMADFFGGRVASIPWNHTPGSMPVPRSGKGVRAHGVDTGVLAKNTHFRKQLPIWLQILHQAWRR